MFAYRPAYSIVDPHDAAVVLLRSEGLGVQHAAAVPPRYPGRSTATPALPSGLVLLSVLLLQYISIWPLLFSKCSVCEWVGALLVQLWPSRSSCWSGRCYFSSAAWARRLARAIVAAMEAVKICLFLPH